MNAELRQTAQQMVAPGKGILAADESTGTIAKRFDQNGIENSEESRRQWRQLLFTTEGMAEHTSGVIMYDETLRQADGGGTGFARLLAGQGVLPGIKVDNSTRPLALGGDEVWTEGLDGLRERLEEYRGLGAKFTKWRAVIKIGQGMPSDHAIRVNASGLAQYAALSQEQGLVPMVEPEVLMDGSHSLDECYAATEATLLRVFAELAAHGVELEGMVLKPNMVISASDAQGRADAERVADATLCCFRRTVPVAVPGIAFLSGGQGDEEATRNLDAINRLAQRGGAPWQLTFSYGRGLQAAPLAAWRGESANVGAAQEAFAMRLRDTALAREGRYGA